MSSLSNATPRPGRGLPSPPARVWSPVSSSRGRTGAGGLELSNRERSLRPAPQLWPIREDHPQSREWGEGLRRLQDPLVTSPFQPLFSLLEAGLMTPTFHGAASLREAPSPLALPPARSRSPSAAGPLNSVLRPKDPQPGREPPQPPAESHLAPRCGPEPQSKSRGSLPASLQGTHHGGAEERRPDCPEGPLSPGPGRGRRWR